MISEAQFEQLLRWLIPVAFAVGGLISGVLIEWILIRSIISFAKKTKARWDDVLAKSLHFTVAALVFITGLWFATLSAPFADNTSSTILNVLNGLVALVLFIFLARFASGITDLSMDRLKTGLASASLISNSVGTIILLVGIVFILDNNFKIELGPIFAALGIGGLAAALALQDTLSNLFSGFQIIAARQVRVGDYVKLDSGELGFVADINWRNVTIQSHPDMNMIIVPNSRLASTVMINYNLPRKLLMEVVTVGVAYNSDLKFVEKIALEVAIDTITNLSGKKPTKEPQIRFYEFGDSSVNFQARLFLPQLKGRAEYKHEYIKNLHERFNLEGIEIPFPIRTVYMQKESS